MIVLYPFYINSKLFNIRIKKNLDSIIVCSEKERENLFHRSKDEETGIEDEEGNKDPIFLIEVQQ